MPLNVILEATPKRAFASALDWPGWSRGAKTPDEAIAALLAYRPRYATVAERAGVPFAPPSTVRGCRVVETLAGGSGTDFGVPSASAAREADMPDARELERLLGLLRAAWSTFEELADRHANDALSLGPRGGGRQAPKMRQHVHDADAAYLRQLGARPPAGEIVAIRSAFEAAVRARVSGDDIENPTRVKRPWAPRYAIRRSAWHALDHAWEIEDRAP